MMTTDDELSISILKAIAQERFDAAGEIPIPEMRSVLATAFGGKDPAHCSEGELARAALDLLRQDLAFAEDLKLMAIQASRGASPNRYFEPITISTLVAALLVLQTRIKFKMDSDHKWTIEIDKKSFGDSAVKLLVQRLLPFLSK
jgi:hypothetical protein